MHILPASTCFHITTRQFNPFFTEYRLIFGANVAGAVFHDTRKLTSKLKFLPSVQFSQSGSQRLDTAINKNKSVGKNTLRNADCGMRNVDHGYFAECEMRKKLAE